MPLRAAALPLMLTALLAGCSGERSEAPTEVEQPVQFQRASAQLTDHGERISRVLGCNGCHGDDLTGQNFSELGFGRLWSSNLTRVLGAYSDQQLAKAIRTGVRPDGSELWGMPSFLFTHLSDADMSALISYLRSKAPAGEEHPRGPIFEEGARKAIAAEMLKSSVQEAREKRNEWPPDLGAEHALARHIARSTCAECHGIDLAGGQPLGSGKPRPDLRMVASYEAEQFKRLLQTGIAAGDRELELMSGVARARYRHLTDEELSQLYSYLRELGSSK